MQTFLLLFFGFITGLIDSVVGGGGLISLPFLTWMIAPGPEAIGTNKIVGTTGALISLIVYARKGHLLLKAGLMFCVVCAIGSYCGSSFAPYVPKDYFKYIIILVCPIILYIVWNKDKFFAEKNTNHNYHWSIFFASAFLSGFYDGFFGPGGGTFMFLSLYLGTGFPLLTSIAISKLANTFSAGTALLTYSYNGYVHWEKGLIMAIGMAIGSFIGATYNTKMDAKIVRPALTIVVLLLISKLIFFS
jgi:uncharacterized membrane protein YfcA